MEDHKRWNELMKNNDSAEKKMDKMHTEELGLGMPEDYFEKSKNDILDNHFTVIEYFLYAFIFILFLSPLVDFIGQKIGYKHTSMLNVPAVILFFFFLSLLLL